jgi:glycosyltransferase involved in cell wall biosynthesis
MKNFDVNNWSVITNGYDEADFVNLNESENVDKKKFNIAFLGTIHADINSPEYLFRAIKYLKDSGDNSDREIHFHHIGHSALPIERLAKKYNIENQITLWNYRSHKEALQILTAMDAFYQTHHPGYNGSKYIIGGKMYEYLRLKKPILAVVPEKSEVSDIINSCNCGESVNSVHAEEIAAALLRIIKGGNSYSFSNAEQYERKILADKFISVFTEAINKSLN